jgi:hypothetical protein
MMERGEDLSKRIIFSDEATFHLSGKVNRHNIRTWGFEKPVAVVEMERDIPKVNVLFCRFQKTRVRPVLICGEVCYGTGVPENITKTVNATTRRRGGVHFPKRR